MMSSREPKTEVATEELDFEPIVIRESEDLLNALQNLKVQITVSGTTRTVTANIQFSGKSAVLIVEL